MKRKNKKYEGQDRWVVLLIAVCLVIGFLVGMSSFSHCQSKEIDRTFWPVTIQKLASGTNGRSHVEVSGVVGYKKQQGDGDWHLRIDDKKGYVKGHWIVAECVPELPQIYEQCDKVKVGEVITVRGISRQDPEHKWWEVHPILQLFQAREPSDDGSQQVISMEPPIKCPKPLEPVLEIKGPPSEWVCENLHQTK